MFSVLNNLSLSDFNLDNVSKGFQSGCQHVFYPYEKERDDKSSLNGQAFIRTTWEVGKLLLRAQQSFHLVGNVQNIQQIAQYSLAGLVAVNLFALVTGNHPSITSPKDKKGFEGFLYQVWMKTPYLIMLTNAALTVLESRLNPAKGIVTLSSMLITYLIQKRKISASYGNIVTKAYYPVAALAFYLSDNTSRVIIGVEAVTGYDRG